MALFLVRDGLSQHSSPIFHSSKGSLKISETCAEINPSRTGNNAICIAYQFYTYWHDNCCIIKCPHIRGNDKMIRLISKCIIALHNTVYIICAIWGGFLEALAPLAIDRLPIACPILRFSKHTHSKRPLVAQRQNPSHSH